MKQIMKKWISLLLCVAFVCPLIGSTAFAAGTDTIQPVQIDVTYGQSEARSMLDMINDFRTGDEAWYWDSSNEKVDGLNLGTLVYDYELEKAAMQRAAEIALSFSHTRTDGSTCFTAYSYRSAGENIAAGYRTAEAVFEGWKETDEDYSGQGHRRNMLSASVTAVGIGHVYYNGYHYWVQEFRSPASSAQVTAANDSKTTVNLNLLVSDVTVSSVSAAQSSLTVESGETIELPKVNAVIRMGNAWPSINSTVAVDCSWSVADSQYATISNGKITGIKTGTTTLTASVFGNSVSVPLTVIHTHTPAAAVKENETAPTCTKTGSFDEVIYCSECGEELSRETKTVAALGHTYAAPTYTWTSDRLSCKATFTCVSGDDTKTVNCKVTSQAGTGETTFTATCTFNGQTYQDVQTVSTSSKFTDVIQTAYYYNAVEWAIANKVTSGTTPTTFSPNAECTRAEVVVFLWNLNGKPMPTLTENPFTDVKSTDWFYNAMMWAVENRITSGTTPTTFSPNTKCTRAQIVAFLWNMNGKPAVTVTNPFTDMKSTDWCYTAVMWAVQNKITSGTTATTFSPNTICDRAQIVTFLWNMNGKPKV